jgi:hypothetical protein
MSSSSPHAALRCAGSTDSKIAASISARFPVNGEVIHNPYQAGFVLRNKPFCSQVTLRIASSIAL